MTTKRLLAYWILAFCLLPGCMTKTEQPETAVPTWDTLTAKESARPDTTSRLRSFLSKKGVLFVKDFYSVGHIVDRVGKMYKRNDYGVEIKAIVITLPEYGGKKIKGLRVETTNDQREPSVAFVDQEEMDEISKAIDYLISTSRGWAGTSREYSEVTYMAKDNIQLGFYQSKLEQSGFLKCGFGSTSWLLVDDLPRLKQFVDDAQTLLKTK